MKRIYQFLLMAMACLAVLSCSAVGGAPAPQQQDLVILEVGHSQVSGGATSPDKRVQEFFFWYRNVAAIKEEIERAGYRVIVCTRGKAPAKGELADLAASIPVVHLNDRDTGKRYPSKYHPDRIGAGMVCADYGIEQRPACMLFLHLNCIGSSWRSGACDGLVLCNKHSGVPLGTAIATALNTEIFNQPGGIDNGGRSCRPMVRTEKALGGAGWLNTLDDEHIPAAVIEAVYTDNRNHVDFISKPENAKKLSTAIAHGIIAWLRSRGK